MRARHSNHEYASQDGGVPTWIAPVVAAAGAIPIILT